MWYRLRFDADRRRASGELLALYIERVCGDVAGAASTASACTVGGRMREPITLNCEQPQLVALPAALLQRPRQHGSTSRLAGYALEQVASRQRAGAPVGARRSDRYAALAAAPTRRRSVTLDARCRS